jgi:nucleotide-binding universal stress UspA family protein
MTEIRNILVPTDYSPHAAKALDYAIGLAKTFNAKISLVHSYHIAVPMAVPDPVIVPQGFWEEARKRANEALEELKGKVEEEGLSCETHVSAEPPFQAITDIAASAEVDLIVMGTRGLTGLKHVLLGSVAERTVRLAQCPVITVKDADA